MDNKAVILVSLIFLVFISGCLQQKPYEDSNMLIVNQTKELYATGHIEQKLLSKGQSAIGSLDTKATFFYSYSIQDYSYFDADANKNYLFEPKEGFIFLVIHASIENHNEDSIMTGANDFSLVDKDGYRFYPKIFYVEDALPLIDALDYKQKFEGKMLFEIPKNRKNLLLQFRLANAYAWPILIS